MVLENEAQNFKLILKLKEASPPSVLMMPTTTSIYQTKLLFEQLRNSLRYKRRA
jgi:hypothetical protein